VNRPANRFSPVKSRIGLVALLVATGAGASGCYQGFNTSANSQRTSGNGVNFLVGDIAVQSTALVVDPANPNFGSLVFSLVNKGSTPETLTEVSVAGATTNIVGGPLSVGPGKATQVGYPGDLEQSVQVTGITALPGRYVPVSFTFASSGRATQEILAVPATGVYENVKVPRVAGQGGNR
jgi:hypothetical protein